MILPEGYTDFDGNLTASPTLTDDEWTSLADRDVRARPVRRRRARRSARVPHPRRQPRGNAGARSSASSTARTPTPCSCAWTPATSRTAAPTTSSSSRDYPDAHPVRPPQAGRPRRSASASIDEQLGFAPAVRLGVMAEPPLGEPDMPSLLAALGGARPRPVLHRRAGHVPVRVRHPAPDRTAHPRVLRELRPRRRPRRVAADARPPVPRRGVQHDHPRRRHRHRRHRRPTTPTSSPTLISGSTVRAVTDINRARAEQVAADVGGARVFDDGHDAHRVRRRRRGPHHLDRRDPRRVHARVIAAGKPVLCEKPLAPTTPECEQILDAEVAARQAPRDRRLHAPLRPGLPAGQGVARRAAPSACR